MSKIKAFFSAKRTAAMVGLGGLLAGVTPALAAAQTGPTTTVTTPDLVKGGTDGLAQGVSVLTSFLYSALPIILSLVVASAVVMWVIRKVGRGAH